MSILADRGSVGEDFPREQARVRELVKRYRLPIMGGAGELAARLMELILKEADEAMASGDVLRIVVAYQKLRGCKE